MNLEARRAVATNTWQAFLRERIVSLGYYAAGDVWLRSNTFRAGHFTQHEIEEQAEYARWCRDTILGFERYPSSPFLNEHLDYSYVRSLRTARMYLNLVTPSFLFLKQSIQDEGIRIAPPPPPFF
jgi:hypothetical protein